MVDFDLSAFDAVDESYFIAHATDAVRWVWTYAGPGHPKTIEISNRRAKKDLHETARQQQAIVNGKKWKAEEQSVEEAKEDTVRIATERLLGWHLEDVKTGKRLPDLPKLNGEPLPFSEANAMQFLREPRRIDTLRRALEWLGDENSFTQRSATTSGDSLSEHSSSTGTKKAAPAETA